MSLQIASLNSGSNGNCYYIGNDEDAVLIDAGISCRETEKRMKQLGLSMKKVKAVFISHEHTDHIKGLSTLANRYYLPIYITELTAKNTQQHLTKHLSKHFIADVPIEIGSIKVIPFAKMHDAIDPHSFIISYAGVTVGVFTDIGNACAQVINYFKQCHAAFLEANYDDDMLETGKYPFHLKQRIRSDVGHLSNKQALDLFIQHRPTFMSHLLLSHISKENNHPDIAINFFAPHAANTNIVAATRYKASDVYFIKGENNCLSTNNTRPVQLGLF